MTMEPSFAKLLAKLADARVRFIVVGGVAVTLNGYARLTEDVDVLVQSSRPNIEVLLAALSDYGEGFARELSLDDFDDDEGAIRIVEETEQCQIDVFTRMSGLHYEDFVSDAGHVEVAGKDVLFASKATLIRLKSGSVREKDRLDVMALQKLAADPHALD
jgi:predicted nucleotidyltransferase